MTYTSAQKALAAMITDKASQYGFKVKESPSTMLERLIRVKETEAANAERLKIWKGYTKYDVKCYDPCGRICLVTGHWASPEDIGKELLKDGYIVIGYWKAIDTLAKQPV